MDAHRALPIGSPDGAMDDDALPLRRLAESSGDVFWLADVASQQLLYVSKRVEQLWGVSQDQLCLDPGLWTRALHAEDADALPTPFFAPHEDQDGDGQPVREYRIHGRDGATIWIRDRRFQLRNEQGRVVRVGGIAEDVTERKQAELEREALLQRERQAREQAELLAQSKDEFLAVVTHELRSPLSAIRGWAHVLRGSGELNALQLKALDAIDRNTQSQARMVDDLLDSQRILAGKFELAWGQPLLSALIDEAVETVQPLADAKQITLSVSHDSRIATVSADINRLRQALVNLLTNAVKFTPESGAVNLSSQFDDQGLHIRVQDNGVGLVPQQMPTALRPAEQADNAHGRPQRGLALGLSLAQQLIALHGGQLRVESAGTGQGSAFTIELPSSLVTLVAAAPASAEPDWPHDDAKTLQGHRIMIVEDDDDGREALGLILKDHGAELLSFSEAGSAYEYLAYSPASELPHALVSDIAMPREDGYEFIRRVRALEQQRHRPRMLALALTAFGRAEDRQRAHAAGFDAHLAKPLDSRVVIQSLQEALGSVSRQARETRPDWSDLASPASVAGDGILPGSSLMGA